MQGAHAFEKASIIAGSIKASDYVRMRGVRLVRHLKPFHGHLSHETLDGLCPDSSGTVSGRHQNVVLKVWYWSEHWCMPLKVLHLLKNTALRLMQVRPYFFDFKASVKARWRGMSVIEVFLSVRYQLMKIDMPFCSSKARS